ncbi:hypothetical protein [Turicimonas sp. TL08]
MLVSSFPSTLKVFLFSCVVSLAGCASSNKYMADEIIDANRPNGTVDVGFYHSGAPLSDDGQSANWTHAIDVARRMCKKWGYNDAEPINNRINWEGRVNGYGYLLNGKIWMRFLCTGEETINVQHKPGAFK